MRISSFGYLIKEGSKNVWVNRLMSFASVGVLTACMLLIGASVLLSVNMNNIVGHVESQNEFIVYMEDVTDDQLSVFDRELEKIDNLADIRFLPKEEVLAEWSGKVGDALEGLKEGDNPLPDTYYIKVKNLERLSETVADVEELAGVDSIDAPTDVANTLVSIRKIVIAMGVGIIALLVAVSLMIIANTIKITVFNRRKEISIMKYVGATDTFIKFPFVVEGLILGVIAASLAYFVLWGGYNYLLDWVAQNPSDTLKNLGVDFLPFHTIGLQLYGGFATGGVLLGVVGSLVFVRNYVKV